MEKFQHMLSMDALTTRFRALLGGGGGMGGPNFVWRIMLGSALLCAAIIGVFAWLTYQHAVEESALPPTRVSRDPFSIEDLRELIALYEKKENDYSILIDSRPKAPPLED